jgi:hypothetical protein
LLRSMYLLVAQRGGEIGVAVVMHTTATLFLERTQT